MVKPSSLKTFIILLRLHSSKTIFQYYLLELLTCFCWILELSNHLSFYWLDITSKGRSCFPFSTKLCCCFLYPQMQWSSVYLLVLRRSPFTIIAWSASYRPLMKIDGFWKWVRIHTPNGRHVGSQLFWICSFNSDVSGLVPSKVFKKRTSQFHLEYFMTFNTLSLWISTCMQHGSYLKPNHLLLAPAVNNPVEGL